MSALRIGLVYDLLGTAPREPGAPPDADAEFEPEATVEALERAIRWLGHEPARVGNARALLRRAGAGEGLRVDAAWNIAEGYGTRNREAWAPVLLEMLEIPTLGSDALTLSLSLDKAWAKEVIRAAGVPAPPHAVAPSLEALERVALPGPFPLFVKPRWEGASKGIGPGSRVADRADLERETARILSLYRQPALIEPFLPGAEYTVTLIGNAPPRVLPVLQRALESETGIGLHALERHAASAPAGGWSHDTPGRLDAGLENRLGELALRAFAALACRDFARVDFRLDARGEPQLLEVNPLPTFAPEGSFGILAELMGRELHDLLAEVLFQGLRRLDL